MIAPETKLDYKPYGVLTLAVRYGIILTIAMLVLGGGIGFLVSGLPGLFGALIGAGLTAVLMALSAASFLLAVRVTKGDPLNPLFYAVVLGASALKIVAFQREQMAWTRIGLQEYLNARLIGFQFT